MSNEDLMNLLPKVKLTQPEPRKVVLDTSEVDAYLATLSESEVKAYKLKVFLREMTLRSTRKVFPEDVVLKMPKPIKYVATVFTEPIPWMSGYREHDAVKYEEMKPIPFESFQEARRFYNRLLKAYTWKETHKRKLSDYD